MPSVVGLKFPKRKIGTWYHLARRKPRPDGPLLWAMYEGACGRIDSPQESTQRERGLKIRPPGFRGEGECLFGQEKIAERGSGGARRDGLRQIPSGSPGFLPMVKPPESRSRRRGSRDPAGTGSQKTCAEREGEASVRRWSGRVFLLFLRGFSALFPHPLRQREESCGSSPEAPDGTPAPHAAGCPARRRSSPGRRGRGEAPGKSSRKLPKESFPVSFPQGVGQDPGHQLRFLQGDG